MQVPDQDVSAFRKAAMSTGKQRFQILRNRDWRQIVWISAMQGCDRNFKKCLGAGEQGSTQKGKHVNAQEKRLPQRSNKSVASTFVHSSMG
jgi:hypothetical protein